MTMNTRDILRALAVVAGSKENQFRLSMTKIRLDGKEACTTDGFILAVAPVETSRPGLIDTRAINEAKGLDIIDLDTREVKRSKWTNGPREPIKIEDADPELKYPEIEKVRRARGQNKHLRVGLGIAVLENIVKMLKKSDQSMIALEFTEDPMAPVFGTIGEIELTIMPYRIN